MNTYKIFFIYGLLFYFQFGPTLSKKIPNNVLCTPDLSSLEIIQQDLIEVYIVAVKIILEKNMEKKHHEDQPKFFTNEERKFRLQCKVLRKKLQSSFQLKQTSLFPFVASADKENLSVNS